MVDHEADRPLSRDQLTDVFRANESPSRPALIGVEHEKLSFRLHDGGPVPYFGKTGIQSLLLRVCEREGFAPYYVEGFVLAASKGAAQITLEPGGQIELSGSPLADLGSVKRELEAHLRAVAQAGDELGIGLSSLAFHPDRDPFTIEFVPKPRYPIMRRYFQRSGRRGLHMMACTATVQLNLDYESETDAFEKIAAAQRASPYVSAIFNNAPFELGKLTSWQSRRYATWLDVDNTRTGLLDFAYEPTARYADYAAWALRAPLFGIHRHGVFLPCPPLTFEEFLDGGLGRNRATHGDWLDHLGTLYPEVRLKRTIELRGVDSGNAQHSLAAAAIWRGLLDDRPTRWRLIAELPVPRSPRELQRAVALEGLFARDGDGRVLDRALGLAHLARAGLHSLGEPLAGSVLEPVLSALEDGLCPADEWRQARPEPLSPHALLLATRYLPER